MNEKTKSILRIIGICAGLLVFTGINVYSCLRDNRRDGSREQLAVELNQQLTDEQLRAVATVERIRGLTEKTTANLGELSVSAGRQGELLKELRAKLEILESYYRYISGELGGNVNNNAE